MDHLKLFETQDSYLEEKSNLPYPCVSYVKEDSSIRYKNQNKIISKFKITDEIISDYSENDELVLFSSYRGNLSSYEINGEKYGPFEKAEYGDYIEKRVEFYQREDGFYEPYYDSAIKDSELNEGIYFTFNVPLDVDTLYWHYKSYYDGVKDDSDSIDLSYAIKANRIIYDKESNTIRLTKWFCEKYKDEDSEHFSRIFYVSSTPYNNEINTIETTQWFSNTIINEDKLSPSEIRINASSNLGNEIKLKTVYFNDEISTGNFSEFPYYINLTSFCKDKMYEIEENKFSNFTYLKNIKLGNNITNINYSAFYNCSSLESINIPDSVSNIYSSVFEGCTKLKKVRLSDNISYIYYSVFKNCYSLSEITLPKNLEGIYDEAFMFCTNLKHIVIPENVVEIMGQAFNGCSNLSSITCNAIKAPYVYKETFNDIKRNGILRYPQGSDYSSWMQDGEYYLGYYDWTSEEF